MSPVRHPQILLRLVLAVLSYTVAGCATQVQVMQEQPKVYKPVEPHPMDRVTNWYWVADERIEP